MLAGTHTSANIVGLIHYWTATNGTITSGQGTNSVSVTWNPTGGCALNVLVAYINNCKISKTLIITRSVGIDSKQNILDVNVFPNPARDKIMVSIQGEENNLVEIFNMIGDMVLFTNASQKAEINISQFSSGTYFLRVSNQNGSTTKKLMKF